MIARAALGAAGVAGMAYGGLLLARLEPQTLTGVGLWLAAGVVLHDAVLAPFVLLLALAAARVLPSVARGPVVAGAVVLGSVTLLAVPVLGAFGRRPDNDTLLDRDYTAGWLLLAGLTLLGVTVAIAVRARRRRGSL